MGSFILSLHTQHVTTDSIFHTHSHSRSRQRTTEDFLFKEERRKKKEEEKEEENTCMDEKTWEMVSSNIYCFFFFLRYNVLF